MFLSIITPRNLIKVSRFISILLLLKVMWVTSMEYYHVQVVYEKVDS